MSTGNEILEPGAPMQPGKIYNINSTTLGQSLRRFGCHVTDLGVVKDERPAVEEAIANALKDSDIVMLSGGSSLGSGDMVPEIMAQFGALLFHGIAVKPGKPTALAVSGQKLIFGLPGYPTSALSNYYILIEPVLEKMSGRKVRKNFTSAVMERKILSTIGRYHFLPVKLKEGTAVPVLRGSSSITSLAMADGFVEIEENVEVVEKGATVTVRLI
jgi:molybdopterin molybdotransferase